MKSWIAVATLALSYCLLPSPTCSASETPIGYAAVGAGTTGGTGGTTATVTDLDGLRDAVAKTGPAIIHVDGMIDLGTENLSISSDKTLLGQGATAGFKGHVYIEKSSNIILRNLTFTNPSGAGTGIGKGDGLTFYAAERVWVDHCDFIDCADGHFDITHGSDFITVSWCKFSYTDAPNNHRLSMLIGNRDDLAAEDQGKLHVTLHHNWIGDRVSERAPRVRFGCVHIFNNYYGATENNTCIGLGIKSQILLESSYFDGIKRPWKLRSEEGPDAGRLATNEDMVYTYGPKIQMGPTAPVSFKPPYPYELEPAASVKETVLAGAGVGRGPFASNATSK